MANWLLREQARVYDLHGHDPDATAAPDRLHELAERLPETFSTADLIAAGLSRRTAFRRCDALVEAGLAAKEQHGRWRLKRVYSREA